MIAINTEWQHSYIARHNNYISCFALTNALFIMGEVLTEAEMWSLLIEDCNNREFSDPKS